MPQWSIKSNKKKYKIKHLMKKIQIDVCMLNKKTLIKQIIIGLIYCENRALNTYVYIIYNIL